MPPVRTQPLGPHHRLGEHIRRLRVAAGLTQDELGRRAGMSRAVVQHIESGHRQGRSRTLRRLAAALDAPYAELAALAAQFDAGAGEMTVRVPGEDYADVLWWLGCSRERRTLLRRIARALDEDEGGAPAQRNGHHPPSAN
jgi:transcriptional regulator with XRE-family HTH domain